jgi:hypothetical protein
MCTLEETLNNFVHDKKHQDGISENDLNEWFKKIAQIILSGHFEIKNNNNDKECVIVRPTTVEMYFHEEREGNQYIKDYIVYHRNHDIKKINDSRKTNDNQDIKYYPLGVLNTHPSGIDITFESKDYRFRASALIRAFKVEATKTEGISEEQYQNSIKNVQKMKDVTGVQYINQKKVDIDSRSTYIYDALFSQFNIFGEGFSVKWVDWKDKQELIDLDSINTDKRQNVYEYKIINKDSNHLILEKQSVPDTRQWSFSVKENQDQQQ